jgi:1,4-dihydroxy-2-naphthoate octaprenyltransferase
VAFGDTLQDPVDAIGWRAERGADRGDVAHVHPRCDEAAEPGGPERTRRSSAHVRGGGVLCGVIDHPRTVAPASARVCPSIAARACMARHVCHDRPMALSRSRQLLAFAAMARPAQLALIGVVYVTGVLLGLVRRGEPRLDVVLLGAVVLLFAASSVHLANEYVDVETDAITERTAFSGGSGVLPRGLVDRRIAAAGSFVAGTLACGATLLLVVAGIVPGLAGTILLAGLAGGIAYSVPPLAAARRGVGEVLNATLGGMLLPLYGVAVARGSADVLDVIAFAPFTLVVFLSVMATAWADRSPDAATGKRTLQTRLPASTLRRMHAAVIVLFVAAEAVSALLGASPAAPVLLVLLPLLAAAHRRYTVVRDPSLAVLVMVIAAILPAVLLAVTLTR